ncbi:NAD-dependent epimerase/dehydratase family protein [Polyangium mundeleinium]|uniref:NAD-dependent epimerase/dehydratase family protein n=1 Tax=Polyangium mundeleinium TaxID=2995306 RepID=A0ABT5EPT4_9BACT|nr:NAD-dependent epimerase/dehydratase family protein [Polyangium mundeleinium]MDC0742932.1 NAD-dependent epimerase/dehydratase family protein [Polyangium mundeleinium]
MRLVILGCGGFIGSHLLDRLLVDDRFEIDGWDPDVRKIEAHLNNPRLRLRRSTIRAPGALEDIEAAIARADVVLNLAAICNPADYNKRPLAVINANLFDLHPIIELCSAHRRWLISFSTSEVYGRTIASYLPANKYDDPALYELREDDTPLIMGPIRNQRWTYACAKQMTERLIYAHHAEHEMPFTIIRPLNFFGPKMDYIPGRDGEGVPRVLACFMTALMDGKPLQLVDGGQARRTIISIHEAIDAIMLMLERPEKAQNNIFNIGNRNNEVTMAELADAMRRTYAVITGSPRYNDHPIVHVSALDFYGTGYEDCDRRMPDTSKAERLLGWRPKRPLSEVLLETMTYYHQHYARDERTHGLQP